jgi:hypothetical protein
MPFHLVFLSALMLGSQNSPNPPGDPPADPEFPLPLYHDSPPSVTGLFISGGSLSGSGVGWNFADGSSLKGMSYCLPFFRNANSFYCAHLGRTMALSGEWYLGSGVVCQLKFGIPILESRIGIDWYAIEGLRLGFGFVNGQLQLGWQLNNPEDFEDLLGQLVFAAYWLQSHR